jgi:hypothetical protein|tara:strand:+ start:4716 stop:4910 length:195 start_codon:yes stop_codon:yes gene_type:complete
MSKKRRQKNKPTLEELQEQLAEAVGRLSEAFTNGLDSDVSSLTAQIRAIEQEINDRYYSRFGTP